MDWLAPLIALTAMEIVLGIDNIVFIAILAAKLPADQQNRARVIGLGVALVSRLLLLFSISLILQATTPLFHLTDVGVPDGFLHAMTDAPQKGSHGEKLEADELAFYEMKAEKAYEEVNDVSTRDLILLFGGLFLIWKSVREIHHKLEGHNDQKQAGDVTFASVIIQIAILDIVFSLDSVITAVGMADELWVMVVAVVIAVGVMMAFAGRISDFVDRHPTVKMLALSFLILIGVLLLTEAVGTPIQKGYVYFAMAFGLLVEMLNIRLRTTLKPAHSTGDPLRTANPSVGDAGSES